MIYCYLFTVTPLFIVKSCCSSYCHHSLSSSNQHNHPHIALYVANIHTQNTTIYLSYWKDLIDQ